jgi:hypothetical protein
MSLYVLLFYGSKPEKVANIRFELVLNEWRTMKYVRTAHNAEGLVNPKVREQKNCFWIP